MSTMQQIFHKIKTDITKSNPTVPGLIQRLSDYSDELSRASGGSGDSVEVTQIQSTGTKIASVAVNGVGTDLYAPAPTTTLGADHVSISAISGITGDDVQDALEDLQSNKAKLSDLEYADGTYTEQYTGIGKANVSGTSASIIAILGKTVPAGKIVTINSVTIGACYKYDGTVVSGGAGSASFSNDYPNRMNISCTATVTAHNAYYINATVNFTIS